ncbi:MAG: MFS transporter [Georgfuchsia sp.]
MNSPQKLTSLEWRATTSLALIFALRMFGMFSILPVLAIYARGLPGGDNQFLIGVALGIDGLAQACLQIPFGLLSDRFGRKRMIYIGLALFALGSFIAAGATTLPMIIVGRLVQGTGAVSSSIIALLADLTREERRSTSMAVIGMSIGITFGVSLVLGPTLEHFIGVPGIFALTGILAGLAMLAVRFVVPNPLKSSIHGDAETVPGKLKAVWKNSELQRLNFGILSLHASMRGLFVAVPLLLLNVGGMPLATHWKVYLPIMVVSFFGAVPAIIIAEKYGRMKPVFCGAIGLLSLSTILMAVLINHFTGIVIALFLFFLAFNLLEATLPSLVSKIAPAGSKGTAIGVYNTGQFLGLFLGGAIGGLLAQHADYSAVFAFSSALGIAWFLLALSMQPPPAVKTCMFHVDVANAQAAESLAAALAKLRGVAEAAVSADEGVVYLKVGLHDWDEAGAQALMAR